MIKHLWNKKISTNQKTLIFGLILFLIIGLLKHYSILLYVCILFNIFIIYRRSRSVWLYYFASGEKGIIKEVKYVNRSSQNFSIIHVIKIITVEGMLLSLTLNRFSPLAINQEVKIIRNRFKDKIITKDEVVNSYSLIPVFIIITCFFASYLS